MCGLELKVLAARCSTPAMVATTSKATAIAARIWTKWLQRGEEGREEGDDRMPMVMRDALIVKFEKIIPPN